MAKSRTSTARLGASGGTGGQRPSLRFVRNKVNLDASGGGRDEHPDGLLLEARADNPSCVLDVALEREARSRTVRGHNEIDNKRGLALSEPPPPSCGNRAPREPRGDDCDDTSGQRLGVVRDRCGTRGLTREATADGKSRGARRKKIAKSSAAHGRSLADRVDHHTYTRFALFVDLDAGYVETSWLPGTADIKRILGPTAQWRKSGSYRIPFALPAARLEIDAITRRATQAFTRHAGLR